MRKAMGKQTRAVSMMLPPEEITYNAEKGYLGGPYDHMNNFITAIRTNGKVTEDAIFGYRAAAPALACVTIATLQKQPYVLGSRKK
jgi:hypothetical protein